MMHMPMVPEIVRYPLKVDNSLFKVYAKFTKNPVGTYDDTILKLSISPFTSFPYTIESITLGFSEESLNKLIPCNKDLAYDKTYEYEEVFYIKPGVPNFINLKTVILSMKLSKYLLRFT